MGRRMKVVVEITSFERDKQFAYKTISGSAIHFQQSFLFGTVPGGTKVTSLLELETVGLLGLTRPFIISILKHDIGANFDTLKSKLENRGPETVE